LRTRQREPAGEEIQVLLGRSLPARDAARRATSPPQHDPEPHVLKVAIISEGFRQLKASPEKYLDPGFYAKARRRAQGR
jgi:hypothetical protein